MTLPDIDWGGHADRSSWDAWTGQRVDVGRFYEQLTARGWKIDHEESNCMISFCRTWRDPGVKVVLCLESFVCAPPYGEVEAIRDLRFFRFDPAEMPTTSMYEQMYNPGDEQERWFAGHREEWAWLLAHGDPQDDQWELLSPITLGEVPAAILTQLRDDLTAAARASA